MFPRLGRARASEVYSFFDIVLRSYCRSPLSDVGQLSKDVALDDPRMYGKNTPGRECTEEW